MATKDIQKYSGMDFYSQELRDTPTGKVLNTGLYAMSNSINNDPAMKPWKDEHVQHGINANISLPLKKFGKVVGVFGLNSAVEHFFDEKEITLLEEAAGDISFALENFHKEKLRRQAEEEIIRLNETLEERVQERTTELTEANKALEAFSYSVSHDLRAPVRTIIGFTKMIQKQFGHDFNPALKELESSGTRMNAIIDDMLTLAKYEKEKLKLAPVDMEHLFTRVWHNIMFTNPHKATLQLAGLPTVEADVSMLEQVVVNLISNAVKYSSKKEQPVVTIGYEKTAELITFFVKDNGAGFDMKNYHRMFGAFQRLHTFNEFEGTGVGLLLVKKIVDKHDGTVWAEGKENEGATFYFTLPNVPGV